MCLSVAVNYRDLAIPLHGAYKTHFNWRDALHILVHDLVHAAPLFQDPRLPYLWKTSLCHHWGRSCPGRTGYLPLAWSKESHSPGCAPPLLRKALCCPVWSGGHLHVPVGDRSSPEGGGRCLPIIPATGTKISQLPPVILGKSSVLGTPGTDGETQGTVRGCCGVCCPHLPPPAEECLQASESNRVPVTNAKSKP